MGKFLRYLIEMISNKIGIPQRLTITIIFVIIALSMYKDFGWLVAAYLPIWAFLMYAYRDE